MLLDRIFEGEVKPNNIAKAKKINTSFLDDLYTKADTDDKEFISKNWDTITKFYAGDQWMNINLKKSRLSYNSLGETVYDFESTFGSLNDPKVNRPRRVVNITKSQIEALVSVFAEVSPLPTPIPTGDFEYNTELISKLRLCLNTMFLDENDFNALYKVYVEGALVYGHYFCEIAVDRDKSQTAIPIKFRYINPQDVKVDPEAVTLDEADYVIQTVKLKYYQLKQIYDYKWEKDVVNAFKGEEPKDMDIVEIQKFYIRFKDGDKTKWLLIPKYHKDWLKFRTDSDNKDSILVFDDLPLVIFRGKVRERWFGSSMVAEMMPSQVEYNKAVSEQDWNWMKVIDAPKQGTVKAVEKVTSADRPGGYLSLGANEQVQTMGNVLLIPQAEFAARQQSIKSDMSEVAGNIDLMQGRRPTGVYSAKMLETLTKAAQLKPKMMEEEFLKSVTELAEKSLRTLANYIGGGTLYLFNPLTGTDEEITAENIRTGTYEIRIETKDANLLTKEARFEIIRDLMQYAKFQEFMPMYYIVRMIASSIPGIIPNEVMDLLKKDYDDWKAGKLNAQMPGQMMPGQPNTTGVPSPASGAAPALPASTESAPSNMPQPPTEELPAEMTDEDFYAQVDMYRQQLLDSGVDPDRVNQMMTMAVDDELSAGTPKEQIIMILEELVNKTANITGQ